MKGESRLQKDFIHSWSRDAVAKRVTQLLTEKIHGLDILELAVADQILNNFVIGNNQLVQSLKEVNGEVKQKIWQYTKLLDVKDFQDLLTRVESDNEIKGYYLDTLVYWMEKYRIDKIINEEQMGYIFKEVQVKSSWRWFTSRYLVKKYQNLLKKLFMSSSQNIEMVLDNFTDGKAKYYFPETVTVDEYVDMFLEYAETEHANLNYLRLVRNSPAGLNKFINVTVKQKVILKERVDVLNKEILENGTTWTRKLGVFSDRYEYDMFNGDKVFLHVKDIKQYVSDPATLLNFINSLDGLWTGGRILNLPSFVNLESNVFERNFGIRSKNHYEETSALGIKLDLVLQQIRIIQHVLGEEGTSIERCFQPKKTLGSSGKSW